VAVKSATFFLLKPMNMKSIFLTLCVLSINLSSSFAQENDAYQLPPKAIADLLLAKPTPFVRIDSKAEYLLLLGRNSYPSVEELGQPEMKIAGYLFYKANLLANTLFSMVRL
jgi:hypothetical protein